MATSPQSVLREHGGLRLQLVVDGTRTKERDRELFVVQVEVAGAQLQLNSAKCLSLA
jgi:hypothetical protein